MYSELSRDQQSEFHQRLIDGDVAASGEIFMASQVYLARCLERKFPEQDEQDRQDVIAELYVSYFKNPTQYNPSKLSLFDYLCMAAEGDMLNFIRGTARRAKHEAFSLDNIDVEDRLLLGNNLVEELVEENEFTEFRDLSLESLIARLGVNGQDAALIKLYAEGARLTQA